MANVLCVFENIIATVAVTEKFFRELSEYDKRIAVKYLSVAQVKKRDVEWCDILYMIRPNNAVFARLAKVAHRCGITVAFYLDDDLSMLPEGSPNMPWRKKGLALSAKNVDMIVSPSPYICKRYGDKYGVTKRVIIDTPVPKEEINKHTDGRNDQIKIVYAAGLGHKPLFDKFIRPVLSELSACYSDRVSLTFMGVHPDIHPNDYEMSISFIPPMSLEEYRKTIADENFDIGLAPLVTDEFTKCKYFNKFIEYAMFGIVGLYSNTEPYTFVIKDKENGLLVGDKPEEWLEAIGYAVDHHDVITKCRNGAYDTLKLKFDPKLIMDGFIAEIPELVEPHKNRSMRGNTIGFIKMQYLISRCGDWIYKTIFYFKRGEISEVKEGIKRKINTIRVEKSTMRT